MQVSLHRKILLELLQEASVCIDPKIEPVVIAQVWICAEKTGLTSKLTVRSTDLRRVYEGVTKGIQVDEPGILALSPEKIPQLLRKLTRENVILKSEDFGAKLLAGNSVYDCLGVNPQDYPQCFFPEDGAIWHTVPNSEFSRWIDLSVSALSKDEVNRINTASVYCLERKWSAINGVLLVRVNTAFPLFGFGIPRTSLEIIKKFLGQVGTFQCSQREDWIFFRLGGKTLGVRTIPADGLLDADSVIPKVPPRATIFLDSMELLGALQRLATVAGDSPVRCSFSCPQGGKGALRLLIPKVGVEELPVIDSSGSDQFEIGLLPSQIIDLCSAYGAGKLKFNWFSDGEPVELSPEREAIGYYMPVRLP